MSSSLFDDLESQPASVGMEAADAKTLRLSAPEFSETTLEALIRYQEAFLAHAEQPSVSPDSLGTAHQLGLQASGLDVKTVEKGNALLRAYSGKRWTARRLKTRLAELEQQADATSAEKARRAREEMYRIEDLEPLARRYRQETIDLLNQHEERLVELHVRMQKVLNRP
jgi:hypothetical protein